MEESKSRDRKVGSLTTRVVNFINTGHQKPALVFLKHFRAKLKAIAMENPVYADIEWRRGEDGLTLLSDDLSWADWATQVMIMQNIKEPWYVKVAAFLADSELLGPLKRVAREYRRARSLLTGGIAEEEWWGLNSSLCLRLAKQLDALAVGGHSWPGPERGYATPEVWEATLREKANDLRRYCGSDESAAALSTWHGLVSTQDADEAVVEAASGASNALDLADRLAAKSALIWVAENLDMLDD